MASQRCASAPWRACKRIKLQSLQQAPSQQAAFSTLPSRSRAQPLDEPTSLVDPSQNTPAKSALSKLSSRKSEDPSNTIPLRRQDQIKAELVNIAKSRNLHIPGILDPANEEKISRMPRSVQALYLAPMRRPVTHGHPVANLQLRSYSVRNLEFMADFALRAAYYLNLPAKGPVPLPRITERWTVPRSNFVHKKSQENWERVTTRRLVQVLDGNPEVVRRWLAFIRKHCWYGVGMKADVFEWEGMDVAKRMDEAAEETGIADDKIRWDLFGKRKGAAGKQDIETMLDQKGFGSAAPPPSSSTRGQPAARAN